jgi:hypothetical protein
VKQLWQNNVSRCKTCSSESGERWYGAKLAPLSLEKDGMGLADREAAVQAGENFDQSNVAEGVSDSSQIIPATSMKCGRPTTSREKPPYGQPKKRTRFCTICKGEGHKSTTCPMRGDLPKPPGNCPSVLNVG